MVSDGLVLRFALAWSFSSASRSVSSTERLRRLSSGTPLLGRAGPAGTAMLASLRSSVEAAASRGWSTTSRSAPAQHVLSRKTTATRTIGGSMVQAHSDLPSSRLPRDLRATGGSRGVEGGGELLFLAIIPSAFPETRTADSGGAMPADDVARL